MVLAAWLLGIGVRFTIMSLSCLVGFQRFHRDIRGIAIGRRWLVCKRFNYTNYTL